LRVVLETDQWLARANEIRRGRCNVQRLTFLQVARSKAAEDVKAVASAIRWDCNLEDLPLEMEIMDTRYVDASYRYSRTEGTGWPTGM
jgi:hypothetical protein